MPRVRMGAASAVLLRVPAEAVLGVGVSVGAGQGAVTPLPADSVAAQAMSTIAILRAGLVLAWAAPFLTSMALSPSPTAPSPTTQPSAALLPSAPPTSAGA